MFCTNCGSQISDDHVFCPGCGFKLKESAVSECTSNEEPEIEPETEFKQESESEVQLTQELLQQLHDMPQQTADDYIYPQYGMPYAQTRKTYTPVIIISCAAALFVLAAVCFAVLFIFRSRLFAGSTPQPEIIVTPYVNATPTSAPKPSPTALPLSGEKLEGAWYQGSGEYIYFFWETVEILFTVTGSNSGIITTDSDEADWYIDSGDILRIRDGIHEFRFDISGETLTITDSDGDVRIYKRTPGAGKTAYTIRAGSETHGYVTVPDTWVEFTDPDAEEDIIQYTDGNGAVITLKYFDADEQIDVYGTIQNIAAKLEDEGAEDVEGARALLGGETVYMLNAYYTQLELYVVIWMFGNEDGSANYICAEGPEESIMDVYTYIENTFSFIP